MASDKAENQINPNPSVASISPLHDKVPNRLSPGSDSEPSILINSSLIQDSILVNSTQNGLLTGHGTRTVHMQPRITVNNHLPQYGSFYTEYDPMTGARTAAILGSLLLLLVFYIIYKAKCYQGWSEEDDYYLQQYKQRQANKAQGLSPNGNEHQTQRRGTSYIIDPVCSPDPIILAATAKWIQMQPLEDAVPDPAPGTKRKNRLAMSKYMSFSAERINRQAGAMSPLVPNGHGPPASGDDAERSCNEYVPNGFLKYIHKESIHGPDWLYNDSQDSSSSGGPVEFYIEEEDRKHHRRRASSHDNSIYMGEHQVDELFPEEPHKLRKKSGKHQLEHFSSLDRHNNNDELEDRTLQLEQLQDRNLQLEQLDISRALQLESDAASTCTNCRSDCKTSIEMQDLQTRTSLFLPPSREILLTPTPRRSKLKARSRQRSHDRASLESHQRSLDIDDDSPDFSLSILPPRDPASVSFDISESSENTGEHPHSTTIASVPMLSYIDNLANNSTFSTMSTATASSNGSYQSEGPTDIPLTDLDLPLPPLAGRIIAVSSQPDSSTVVEVSIETALPSSSKPHDDMDTKL